MGKGVAVEKAGGYRPRLLYLEKMFALGFNKDNSHLIRADCKIEPLTPEQFLWVIPTGSPAGYH